MPALYNRCQLSIRGTVHILQATLKALIHNIKELPVNKSSIQRIQTDKRDELAKPVKNDFNKVVAEVVTAH